MKGGILMDFQAILQMISTVGFPIACCVAMGVYVKYITDKNREEVAKLNDQHKEEMSEVTKAINNNTLALQSLHDYLKEGKERNG
jgi:hypothetical protein